MARLSGQGGAKQAPATEDVIARLAPRLSDAYKALANAKDTLLKKGKGEGPGQQRGGTGGHQAQGARAHNAHIFNSHMEPPGGLLGASWEAPESSPARRLQHRPREAPKSSSGGSKPTGGHQAPGEHRHITRTYTRYQGGRKDAHWESHRNQKNVKIGKKLKKSEKLKRI